MGPTLAATYTPFLTVKVEGMTAPEAAAPSMLLRNESRVVELQVEKRSLECWGEGRELKVTCETGIDGPS